MKLTIQDFEALLCFGYRVFKLSGCKILELQKSGSWLIYATCHTPTNAQTGMESILRNERNLDIEAYS